MKYFSNLLVLVVLISMIACKRKASQPPAMVPNLPAVAVDQRTVESFYIYPADIEGKNNNAVRAKISGYIKKVLVDEGDVVKKGQLLFQLETNVQNQSASAGKAQIEAANANIKAAEAQVQAAQVEVDRLIPLVQKNIISNVQLETAKAKLAQAQGQLSQAKAAYQVAQASYKGTVANINFANITSPINGIVGKINFREGALVSPQDQMPLTNISQSGDVYAYFTLNEKQFIYFFQNYPGKTIDDKLKNLGDVSLQLADNSIYPIKGKIETSTGQIDPNTGTIQFRASFKNNGLLSNGSTAKIMIPRIFKDVLVIPESATYEQQGFVYTYKLQGDSVVNVIVTLSDRVNNLAIIESGLSLNDTVIASGVASLRNGMKVKPNLVNIDSITNIKVVE
ncbi:MAG: efflux RND transporter periplasmic adaptor subunit [Chitinophagales bacterium]|nr:efflux RND transporter periplasmic adaptor subunit [Chitinophagales bacterium]